MIRGPNGAFCLVQEVQACLLFSIEVRVDLPNSCSYDIKFVVLV